VPCAIGFVGTLRKRRLRYGKNEFSTSRYSSYLLLAIGLADTRQSATSSRVQSDNCDLDNGALVSSVSSAGTIFQYRLYARVGSRATAPRPSGVRYPPFGT
jgi:hypothetical protein